MSTRWWRCSTSSPRCAETGRSRHGILSSASAGTQWQPHKILGILCALPLSVNIMLREVMLLHIFAFLPLALYMLWRRRAFAAFGSSQLTTIDRIVLVYFAWAAF